MLAIDTDNDGLPDDWEITNGRNPAVADYAVSAGGLHSCALDDTGAVCWGYNENGQTTVPSLTNPIRVSGGNIHSCALDDTGVVCWGSNRWGQTTVPSLANPIQVSVGNDHTLSLIHI